MTDRTNAKEELIKHVGSRTLKAAAISCQGQDIYLYPNFTEAEYEEFLENLGKINYDSGYGLQELEGEIFYEDGAWATRGEYDGAEWWEDVIKPSLPKRHD